MDVLCEQKSLWLSFHEKQNPKFLAQKSVCIHIHPPLNPPHTHTHTTCFPVQGHSKSCFSAWRRITMRINSFSLLGRVIPS